MIPEFVNSATSVSRMIDHLPERAGVPPCFYLDLEGNNLSRHGTVSLLTLLIHPERSVYLVDLAELGDQAFTTPGSNGSTLKSILESPAIVKVFFDVRNDSDAALC